MKKKMSLMNKKKAAKRLIIPMTKLSADTATT